ncbi:hypothetical protein C8J57DRAFT_1441401 [Mycena rebaudengoi]|nr:hypothetical protein C8J57DRAFT_1441401 [Mycena rebaudengoi]
MTSQPATFEFVHTEVPAPAPHPTPAGGRSQRVRWAPYDAETTSRKTKPKVTPRSVASDIPLDKLRVSADQRAALEKMYRPSGISSSTSEALADHLFTLNDDDQLHASTIMAQHGLDFDTRTNSTRNILYLCKERHTPVPFTSCLGHAEVTYVLSTEKILRIRGYFEHNLACKDAVYTRIPPIPVHSAVFAVALAQLRDGASFTDVKKKNREMFETGSYHSFPSDLRNPPFHSRSLYRQFNRMNGVKVTEKPQINVDEWLNPQSPEYNSTIAEAVFHYSARAEKGDRFEACIATEDMRAAAWKYGHENQIILDGTFGVCDSRLLLFILMVTDENKRGIPVAFLLFSAPAGNKQSSSGYNTSIIAKLLKAWQDSLYILGMEWPPPFHSSWGHSLKF